MKTELFVLPAVMRRDFTDAFVLTLEELLSLYPTLGEDLLSDGIDPADWYNAAYLWDKMSPELPAIPFAEALTRLRSRQGSVLIMSEAEDTHKPCALRHYGREICDFVAIVDPEELADTIACEWRESARPTGKETQAPQAPILPLDLYVFDTTLEWVIVFTHESNPAETADEEGVPSRLCFAFGF